MSLFSGTIQSLENALNYSSTKQKVISQNIANADTPHYKAKDVKFNSSFQNELESSINAYRTDNRHYDFKIASTTQSGLITKNNMQYNNNGNSVDVDQEMSDLATNQIYYNAVTDRISGKFQSMQNVIRGGK
ncbi:flagellar basal body rod protein FlgB [Bacillus sp. CECT 9360]|uniref:flagellar basal body rod protein FlgB n=1 Tax=Bacillus sp. CECT 9360 TaxID=2845821 RepID=UPI001E29D838|nr:flagellar basal body rod protein FlgB [Bacillus sp. CECT 9360]CAH0346196.1 Flagellar basal body rod protein FlgB [Bacillus sp. CECT 9360]